MLPYERESILASLELAIKNGKREQPNPMNGDRWLVASAMQKAIRRGHEEIAVRAATALWMQDRQSFWRRLHVTALEDVGVASPDVVAAVLTATASPAWRKKCGDLRVALFLTRMLCGATKSRAADELYLYIERAKGLAPLRDKLAKADDALLMDCVTDEDGALAERGLASLFFMPKAS